MTTTTSATFTVRGFDNLAKALRNLDGVIRARASFDDANVEVRFDADRVSEQDLRDQITRAGFEAD
jgi:copper chaperone CopZ